MIIDEMNKAKAFNAIRSMSLQLLPGMTDVTMSFQFDEHKLPAAMRNDTTKIRDAIGNVLIAHAGMPNTASWDPVYAELSFQYDQKIIDQISEIWPAITKEIEQVSSQHVRN